MFVYEQLTGKLFRDGRWLATGYSGHGNGKNNPRLQSVHDVGPIPCGFYTIGYVGNTPTHGPFVLSLTPEKENEMFGRSGFLIHGDSIEHPGEASEGCIIMPRPIRELVWARAQNGESMLEVVSGLPVAEVTQDESDVS